MSMTKVSLKRPILCIVVIIALMALGIVGYMRLSVNEMPNSNMPYVSVRVTLNGASPDQIESKVTKFVEDEISQISGVKHVTSNIWDGNSETTIEFNDTIKADTAVQEVKTKISAIRDILPSDIAEPVVSNFNFNELPIVSLSVTGQLSEAELSNLVEKKIVPEIKNITGVGSVKTNGLVKKEVKINLNIEKISDLNLTVDQIANSIRADNVDAPSGVISDGSREITLRTNSKITKKDDFNNIIVATINGMEVRLGSIAIISEGFEDKVTAARYNGKECIGIDIIKRSGANTVKVADDVKRKISQMQKDMPAGVKIDLLIDNSETIRASVKGIEKTMIEGSILAVLIIFIFLRSIGSTVVSAVSLPTSIIITFAAIKMMGFSLNVMSLMGLSLSVGLLVDDAIVVIENIARHMNGDKTAAEAALDATGEISLAVLATTMTIVAVFLPMAIMQGMLGSFFREFGLTVAIAVMISLFISFTLVPLMASKYVKDEEHLKPKTIIGKTLVWFNNKFDQSTIHVQNVLTVALKYRVVTVLIATGLFVFSISLIPGMGVRFSPEKDTGIINITAGLDSGLSLPVAIEQGKSIETILKKYPDVRSIYTTIAKDSISCRVKLTAKEERSVGSKEISEKMRTELTKLPGLDLAVAWTGDSFGAKNYSLFIQGDDFEQLLAYAQKSKQILAEIPGAVDVGLSYKSGKPETRIEIDRDKAADLGISPAAISEALGALYNGSTVGKYEEDGNRIDIKMKMDGAQSSYLNSIDSIYLRSTTTGNMISLNQLTKKVYTSSASQVERYDKKRAIKVQGNFIGPLSGKGGSNFEEKLSKELPPPAGISFGASDDEKEMIESTNSMIQAFVLGILFIFLILAAQFESWIDPLAIMFSLPLAMIGAMISAFLMGSGLTMVGLIGVVFLMGLVTKNAILLIDFIKSKRLEGVERKVAIIESVSIRFRPILMTTIAMILGMVPSALDTGVGSEMRQPMAIVIIGGLISSTLLTLIVIPVIYTLLDDFKVWVHGIFKKPIKNHQS